jgi:hypothetical protein
MRKRRLTRWNVLALIVVVLGAVCTTAAGQLWVHYWAKSGVRVPLGQWHTIDLPAGDMYVYYEVDGPLPDETVFLHVQDSSGRPANAFPNANEDNDYYLAFSGWSGRPLWHLQGLESGPHNVVAWASRHLVDSPTSSAERVVFAKQPNTIAEVDATRKRIQTTGAALTIAVAILLYILHGVSLHRRRVARARECPVLARPTSPR